MFATWLLPIQAQSLCPSLEEGVLGWGSWWLSGKESACSAGDVGPTLGSGRSPGEGNGNPPQYSYLENPMDRGAWQDTIQGSQRVRHNWACMHARTNTHTHTHTHTHTVKINICTWKCLVYITYIYLYMWQPYDRKHPIISVPTPTCLSG